MAATYLIPFRFSKGRNLCNHQPPWATRSYFQDSSATVYHTTSAWVVPCWNQLPAEIVNAWDIFKTWLTTRRQSLFPEVSHHILPCFITRICNNCYTLCCFSKLFWSITYLIYVYLIKNADGKLFFLLNLLVCLTCKEQVQPCLSTLKKANFKSFSWAHKREQMV